MSELGHAAWAQFLRLWCRSGKRFVASDSGVPGVVVQNSTEEKSWKADQIQFTCELHLLARFPFGEMFDDMLTNLSFSVCSPFHHVLSTGQEARSCQFNCWTHRFRHLNYANIKWYYIVWFCTRISDEVEQDILLNDLHTNRLSCVL